MSTLPNYHTVQRGNASETLCSQRGFSVSQFSFKNVTIFLPVQVKFNNPATVATAIALSFLKLEHLVAKVLQHN